jgi:hypothetical protein
MSAISLRKLSKRKNAQTKRHDHHLKSLITLRSRAFPCMHIHGASLVLGIWEVTIIRLTKAAAG